MVKTAGEYFASGILAAMLLIGSAQGASAQTCTTCEAAIRDKLIELDDRTSKTNLLVKTVDRKLDPLAVKVDGLDNKLTVLEEKIDAVGVQVGQIATSSAGKAAVVIDFKGYVSNLANRPADIKAYCQSINYANGRMITINPNYPGLVDSLVCFM